MTVQPDLIQSASKWRQTSANIAPRVPTKKRKMIARRIIKKTAQSSPSPSDSNSNQVIHFFLKLLPYAYILWLTVILFSGRSWRHLHYWKSNSTWNNRKSWCSNGGTWGASWHNQCSCCCLKLNWNDRIQTDHCSFFRTGNTTRINFKSADKSLMYFAPETNPKYLHRASTFQIYSPLTQHQWVWLPLEQKQHLCSNRLTWQISFNSSRIYYLLRSLLWLMIPAR